VSVDVRLEDALDALEALGRALLEAAEAGDVEALRRLLDRREEVIAAMPSASASNDGGAVLPRLEALRTMDEAIRLRIEEHLAATREALRHIHREQAALQGYTRALSPSTVLDVYR
jgi:hypothetical protein